MKGNQLARHVDHLFSQYRGSIQAQEMKEEILSNLEEKMSDYIQQGMSYGEAFDRTIEHIDMSAVEELIDGNQRIYINRYITELVQTALIYCLIAWILTIPLKVMLGSALVMFDGMILNKIFMSLSAVLGVTYAAMAFRKNEQVKNMKAVIDVKSILPWKRRVWQIWGVFIIVMFVTNTAISYGSNIWFGRSIQITGPYALAQSIIPYLYPMISIIIPLLMQRACNIIGKYEVSTDNEKS